MRMFWMALALTAGFTTATSASSADGAIGVWRLEPANSSMAFEYVENGEEKSGAFGAFEARGVFVPGMPEAARFTLEIDVTSIDLGNALYNSFVQGSEWFGADLHPTAYYRLNKLVPIGPDLYRSTGELILKDVKKTIEATVRLQILEGEAKSSGEVAFNRLDFGIGGGFTEMFVELGETVRVRFDLEAHHE